MGCWPGQKLGTCDAAQRPAWTLHRNPLYNNKSQQLTRAQLMGLCAICLRARCTATVTRSRTVAALLARGARPSGTKRSCGREGCSSRVQGCGDQQLLLWLSSRSERDAWHTQCCPMMPLDIHTHTSHASKHSSSASPVGFPPLQPGPAPHAVPYLRQLARSVPGKQTRRPPERTGGWRLQPGHAERWPPRRRRAPAPAERERALAAW